jgi:ATP-dependent Clp protease ATP-binding subunit ClpA
MSDRDKFGKFTERARKVLSLAQEEAQRFQHNYIGTEHLLLGLVREGEGVAAKVLNNLGVDLNKVRSTVEFIIGRGDRIVLGEIGLTPRAKKVIELAVDEARRLNHHYIGTEHLLLGLVREGEGIASGVLESLGVNLERVRTQTIMVLSHAGGTPAEESTEKPTPRLTEAFGKVLQLAQEEARLFQHDHVGTEHLLLGLLREGDGIAAKVLGNLGVELDKLRMAVELISWRGDYKHDGDLELNRRAAAVLSQATIEANRFSHDYISTEHLLLGLTRIEESFAAAALQSISISMEKVRTAVIAAIEQP